MRAVTIISERLLLFKSLKVNFKIKILSFFWKKTWQTVAIKITIPASTWSPIRSSDINADLSFGRWTTAKDGKQSDTHSQQGFEHAHHLQGVVTVQCLLHPLVPHLFGVSQRPPVHGKRLFPACHGCSGSTDNGIISSTHQTNNFGSV